MNQAGSGAATLIRTRVPWPGALSIAQASLVTCSGRAAAEGNGTAIHLKVHSPPTVVEPDGFMGLVKTGTDVVPHEVPGLGVDSYNAIPLKNHRGGTPAYLDNLRRELCREPCRSS